MQKRYTQNFDAAIGIGSNIGDKPANLAAAIAALTRPAEVQLVATSSIYQTAPWGGVKQDWFANACLTIKTTLAPRLLLELCQSVESGMKRRRLMRWGPRVIDVDILTYRDLEIDEPDFIVPHARITERGFVLVPLKEVAPDLLIRGQPLDHWLSKLDVHDVQPIGEFP